MLDSSAAAVPTPAAPLQNEDPRLRGQAGAVQHAIDTIAAAIAFNEITAEDSYEAFDADKDGKLSRADLRVAIQMLSLGIDEDTASALYDRLDGTGQGHINAAAWVEAVSNARDVQSVLNSRGVPSVVEGN